MDKDKNGAVSKDEFMEYMSQTFDRLDVNKGGQLERSELSNAELPFGKVPVQQQ
jgi:Ca2+-binding EF-hand superfamily protein